MSQQKYLLATPFGVMKSFGFLRQPDIEGLMEKENY